jgi:hypothetical protein
MPCRKDHRQLTNAERDRFVAALRDAKDRGVVDQFASDHETFFHAAHHSSVVWPWHREFLRRFELELRVYDARVTIPYWDWRTDASTTSVLWDPSFMGGFDSEWGLGRALGSATLPDAQLVDNTLGITPYGSFWSPLEGPIHSPPHNWVSGVMATAASPGDPIFYLHHCMCDLLWAQWQLLHPGDDPYQSSGAGHGLNDPMAPWTTTPADVVDYRAINSYRYPPGFVSDPALVTGETASIVFADVPEGEHTYRAAVFDVQACGSVQLQADAPVVLTGPAATAFGLISPTVTVNPEADPQGRIWVTFQGTNDGDMATGEVRIRGPESGQDWTIPISANTVRRPTAVAALLLDRSNSMNFPSGIGSLTRGQVLQFSAPPFVDVLEDGNAAAVTTFDQDPTTAIGVTPVAGGGQGLLNGAIAGYSPNPDGWTSIGEAVAAGHDLLVPEVGNYDVRAMVVLTDGHENHGPYTRRYIADVQDMVTERVYAIGLGTAQALNPGALTALCDGHEGYLLLTGALGTDAYFRLAKYYQQILAGVTNNEIVRDPEGQLVPGQEDRIPFWINDADVTATAILLTPAPWAVELELETPDGDVVDAAFASASPAVELEAGSHVVYYRTELPLPTPTGDAHAGRWHAVIRLSKRIKDHRKLTSGYAGFHHGLRYSFSVHAFSGLRMRTTVGQNRFEPGATFAVRAILSESGLPVTGATVRAELERPDGARSTLSLAAAEPGAYELSLLASVAGVYRFSIHAAGHSARGLPFTREQVRTAAVWRGGDRPFPSSETDPNRRSDQLCRVLACLLRQKGLVERLDRTGVDVGALRRCLGELCRGAHTSRSPEGPPVLVGLEERLAAILGPERLARLVSEAEETWP